MRAFHLCTIALLLAAAASAETVRLDKALELARGRSLALRAADAEIAAADAGAREQGTYLKPSFAVSASYAQDEGDDPGRTAGVTLSAVQSLYDGGFLDARRRSAEIAADIARAERERVRLDLAFEVKKAYFVLLFAEKSVEVARELAANREAHRNDVGKTVKEGVLPKAELLRVEVDLAHARNALLTAENARAVAAASLNRLLERPADAEISPVDVPMEGRPALPAPADCRAAVGRRPEIAVARLRAARAARDEDAARSGRRPQVSLRLSHEQSQPEVFAASTVEQATGAVLSVSYDIWNWGRVRERIAAARGRTVQAGLAVEMLERDAAVEIESARRTAVSARDRISAAGKAVREAEELLRMQTLRFREGMARTTDVLDAGLARAQSRSDYHGAVYEYLAAEARLARSMGGE